MEPIKELPEPNWNLYPLREPFSTGFLKVLDLHEIYWEQSRNLKRFDLPCGQCKGRGYIIYTCKLCEGKGTREWSRLYDPVSINPRVCPICDGHRVKRCLDCLGKGYC